MKTEHIQIRVTPELKQKLLAAAEAEGRTLSNYLLYLISKTIK